MKINTFCQGAMLLVLAYCFKLQANPNNSPPPPANYSAPQIQKNQQELFNNNQQQLLNQKPSVDELIVEPTTKPSQQAKQLKFVLKGAKVQGNETLPAEEIVTLIKPYVNTVVTGEKLKQIAAAISKLFADKGYVTSRASLPAQEVKDGVVIFQIEEDKLGQILLAGDNSYQYESRLFFQYFADLQHKVIHAPTLIKRLKLLTFLPATRVKPILRKSGFGKTNLILVLEDTPQTIVTTYSTNAGRYHGHQRLTVSNLLANISGKGDALSLAFSVNPEATEYFSSFMANYSIPFGNSGGQIKASYSYIDYSIDPEALLGFDSYLYAGNHEIANLSFQQPFFLELGSNLWSVGIEKRSAAAQTIQNFTEKNGDVITHEIGHEIADNKDYLYAINIGAQTLLTDQLFGEKYPAQNALSVKLLKSLPGFLDGLTQTDIEHKFTNQQNGISPETGPTGNTAEADADFVKLYITYQRLQQLAWQSQAKLNINWEYTDSINIPQTFDYGGADSGSWGYDINLAWQKSYNQHIAFELGYNLQVAKNVVIPNVEDPTDSHSFIQGCGESKNRKNYNEYSCEQVSPYALVRASYKDLFLSLKYKSNIENFESQDKHLTFSASYRF